MKTKKIIGIILIIGSLLLGYFGINKIEENNANIKFFDLNIDVSNESGKELGYIYLGVAVLVFGAGIYTLKNTN